MRQGEATIHASGFLKDRYYRVVQAGCARQLGWSKDRYYRVVQAGCARQLGWSKDRHRRDGVGDGYNYSHSHTDAVMGGTRVAIRVAVTDVAIAMTTGTGRQPTSPLVTVVAGTVA